MFINLLLHLLFKRCRQTDLFRKIFNSSFLALHQGGLNTELPCVHIRFTDLNRLVLLKFTIKTKKKNTEEVYTFAFGLNELKYR